MSRITTFLCVPVLAVAMVLAGDTPKADAGGFSLSIGSGGYGGYGYGVPGYRYSSGYGGYGHGGYGHGGYGHGGYGHGGYGYGGYGYGGHGFNNGHSAYGPIVYPGVSTRYGSGYRGYTRPHYDYHAPAFVPHGNHLHFQPGHYDLHHGRHGRHH